MFFFRWPTEFQAKEFADKASMGDRQSYERCCKIIRKSPDPETRIEWRIYSMCLNGVLNYEELQESGENLENTDLLFEEEDV